MNEGKSFERSDGRFECTACGRLLNKNEPVCNCWENKSLNSEPNKESIVCDIKFGKLCEGMKSVKMNYGSELKTGVVPILGYNRESKRIDAMALSLRGPGNMSGLMMNFCPFCGENIRPGNDV